MTQTEIARIRERAERTAKRELDRLERRAHGVDEDPDTNRRMILKNRMKWRSTFNLLGLLCIGGLIALFTLFEATDAETKKHTGPPVSETDIEPGQPGPIFTEKRNSRAGALTSYVDRSFWQNDLGDTAEWKASQPLLGVKLFIRNDTDRSVPVPHLFVLDQSGNEFVPVDNDPYIGGNGSLPHASPVALAPGLTVEGTVWFSVPRAGRYVLVVEDAQLNREGAFGEHAHIRLHPEMTSDNIRQIMLVEHDDLFRMLNEIESEQNEFLGVPAI